MIICQKCGAQLQDDSLFCVSCGSRIENPPACTVASGEEFAARTNQICKLANELAAMYTDGMNEMKNGFTNETQKSSAEIAQLRSALEASENKQRELSASLEDAMAKLGALASERDALAAEAEALRVEIDALRTNSAPAPEPAPAVTEEPASDQTVSEASFSPAFDDEATMRVSSAPAFSPAEQPYSPAPEASQPKPRFCSECGTPFTDDMYFCNECGNRLK